MSGEAEHEGAQAGAGRGEEDGDPFAVDLDRFTMIAREEWEALPFDVRALSSELELRIANWPEHEHLSSVGVGEPDGLLGLFEGTAIGEYGATPHTGEFPNRIWLYREPILRFTAEGTDTLRAVIRHVLVHEIGHHFGLSDDEMYAIDDAPDDETA